jgi:hypothetical protein
MSLGQDLSLHGELQVRFSSSLPASPFPLYIPRAQKLKVDSRDRYLVYLKILVTEFQDPNNEDTKG